MNTIETSILLILSLGFIALLVTAMIIQSIPLMVSAFVVGLLGYAMCEHVE